MDIIREKSIISNASQVIVDFLQNFQEIFNPFQ